MKGGQKIWIWVAFSVVFAVHSYSQEPPKEPEKESNGTKASVDQNKTAVVDPEKIDPSKNPDTPAAPANEDKPEPAKTIKKLPPIPSLGGVDFNQFIEQNPFGLAVEKAPEKKPPPRPVKPPKPRVTLTGISILGGKKRAGLQIKVPGASKSIYHRLEEEESANGVKVVSIDSDKGVVRLLVESLNEEMIAAFPDAEPDSSLESFTIPSVTEVQQALNARLPSSQKIRVDGDFGSNTKKALMRFQREKKLSANGQLDEATYEALGLTKGRGRGRGVVTTAPTTKPSEPVDPASLKRPLPNTGRPANRSRPTIRVPSRRRSEITPLQPGYLIREVPTFDKEAQTQLIVASQISTQREFPRGVYAGEPPIDLTITRR